MNSVKRRIAAALLGVVAVCCLFFAAKTAEPLAESIVNSDGMFLAADGVTVAADAAAPDTFATYDGGTEARKFDLGKKGVLLSAEDAGAEVSLAPTFAGDFELTFRAYSSVSYHAESDADYNTSAVEMTPYADLREISFEFTDREGNGFTVAIDAGERWNIITPAARVIVAGTSVGYHYATDAKTPSETALKNSEGYFTRIGGTTFCNVARRGGAYTSENSMPVTFGYNSSEMEIYVIHYGTSSTEETYRVVYDLNAESSGLRAIDEFEDYNVKIKFTDVAEGKTANVVLYELNGQPLSGESFSDTAGAESIVSARYNAVVGEKYLLPEPAAFDVLDGKTEFAGKAEVSLGGRTYELYGADGAPVSEYTTGCYFLPDAEGTYEIAYTARDKAGNYGAEKTLKIKALKEPETSFGIGGNYRGLNGSEAVGKGSWLRIYAATAVSEIFADGRSEIAEAALYRDGELYKETSFSAEEDTDVLLEDEGGYELVYSVKGYKDLKYTVAFTVTASAPVYALSEPLPQKVAVGTEFAVPALTASFGGESKRGTATLYTPGGKVQPLANNKAVITEVGEYKLTYYVRFDTTYTYTVYFEAAHSSEGAFTGDGMSVQAVRGDSGSLYPQKAYGTVLTFTAEDKFAEYTKPIDLSKNTKEDPLISVMVLPSSKGHLDFWQYTVRLTDATDPKNYVNITAFKGSWGNEFSYIKAGGADQMLSGWEKGAVLSAYNTGCPVNYSFTGESLTGTEYLNLYYDYAENAVYVDNIKREGYAYGNQVIDLDSLQCFSENALFKGFGTGEVYLSISVQYLQGDSAKLLVSEVNGVSMESEWIDDAAAPKISVDFLGYDENALPQGEVGVAYPIFPADAFDAVDGRLDAGVKVYKNYQTASQKEYKAENGAFVPGESGVYTIVYSAADRSGNAAEYAVRLDVAEKLEAFGYRFDGELKTEYFVGERFVLPNGAPFGGSGEINAAVSLKDPLGEEVDAADFAFDREGSYTLEISLSDFLGRTGKITYEIDVKTSDSPVVYDVNLYGVMLEGYEYVLPDFYAVDYSSGKEETPEKRIEIEYGGKTETLGADRKFVPRVKNGGDKITVRYVAENAAGKTTSVPYEVAVLKPVGEDGGIDMSAYFYTKGIARVNKTADYVEYVAESEGAELIFANPLVANNLQLDFYVPSAYNKFSAFVFTLTDSEDPSVSVSATVAKNASGGSSSLFDCGNGSSEIYGNFFDKTTYGFSVSYNNNSLYFTDNNANKPMDKAAFTDGGAAFTGFPSQKVYLSIRLVGVEGESALRVVQIGNQYFSDMTADRVAPQFQLTDFIVNTADIGVPYTAPAAVVADVLAPNAEITLTIKKGSRVVYEGAIDEPYVFTPDEYGTYNFVYEASAGGRSRSTTYLVTIKDRIDPELSLNGDVPAEGETGKAVKLPQAAAADNNSENMRVWVFVTEPDGRMYALAENVYEFTPDGAGTYLVSYYVEDDYGNYAYIKREIKVS